MHMARQLECPGSLKQQPSFVAIIQCEGNSELDHDQGLTWDMGNDNEEV